MDINNTDPNRIVNKLTDMMNISRAEYETLLRDKTELDLLLAVRLQGGDSSDTLNLLDTILKTRGMKA